MRGQLLIILLVMGLVAPFRTAAQLLSGTAITTTVQGTITDPRNAAGAITYQFSYSGNEGMVSLHRLELTGSDGRKLADWKARARDLLVTVYIDIEIDTDSDPHTLTVVLDKANRWLKLKFVPEDGCAYPDASWARTEQVGSFAELMEHVVSSIDRNLKIDCYSGIE